MGLAGSVVYVNDTNSFNKSFADLGLSYSFIHIGLKIVVKTQQRLSNQIKSNRITCYCVPHP